MPPAFVRALASLKLTVVLLLVIAVFLSMGTILDSLRGAEAARAVYYAPWFFALEGLFALNIVAALWERWPRNRQRIGFVITHASMLLILAGALVTARYAVDGRLALWEGESSRQFLRAMPGGHESSELMPFGVRLDAFEMDLYPGTQRAAGYRSRITVLDGPGRETHAVIEMNRPYTHGRYRFFQSSYNMADGRKMSILSVAHIARNQLRVGPPNCVRLMASRPICPSTRAQQIPLPATSTRCSAVRFTSPLARLA